MSDSEVRTEAVASESVGNVKSFDDINDQNELDYEEDLDEAKDVNSDSNKSNSEQTLKEETKTNEKNGDEDDGAISDDSDGEVKSNEDTEEKNEKDIVDKEPSTPEEEEDGEINDGEKVKKAFIPRVLCKYYQRGKCTWGRTCKFLHPGVNDTGNYNFLEFQDPNAKVFEQPSNEKAPESSEAASKEPVEEPVAETAWERGLRQAREMKEKAKLRKLAEKESFKDKQMNLSLKEFENEAEADERYLNIEKPPNFEDEEDEDLHMFAQSGRLSTGDRPNRSAVGGNNDMYNRDQYSNRYDESRRSGSGHDYRSRAANDRDNDNKNGNSSYRGNNRSRADEWHDPWNRSRQQNTKRGGPISRRDRSKSYSSSDSDSRSRSHSRSSYSSGSSRSYSSRSSGSSRSGSGSPRRKANRKSRRDTGKKATNPKQLTNDLKKKIESLKNKNSAKSLPGRQISDVSLKKAGLDDKSTSKKKKATSRSRSNTSMSSYGSSDSKSDDDISNDDSDSFSDEDKDYRNKKTANKKTKKRPAQDTKLGSDFKRSKPADKAGDKKQMIKDQLKLLESALKKKSMAK